jgi:hypothetical protein
MAFARLVTHYFHHHAWLDDGQILREAGRLAGIPGVLIHGRFDLGGPGRYRLAARQGMAGRRAASGGHGPRRR